MIVHFDPAIISLGTLAEVHLRIHSAKGSYSPGGRYRSAIYVFAADQCQEAARVIAQVASESGEDARTPVLPFVGFTPSDMRHQNCYQTAPDRPFCRRYVDPKLDYIRRHFAEIALPATDAAARTIRRQPSAKPKP